MYKAKLVFTILCMTWLHSLPAAAQTKLEGQYHEVLNNGSLFFRTKPDMNSPVTDSISAAFNYPVRYNPVENYDLGLYTAEGFVLLDGDLDDWHRVGLRKMEAYANKHNRVEIEQVELVVRYIDKESFDKYAIAEYRINDGSSKIAIYSRPDSGSKTGESITSEYRSSGGVAPGYFYAKDADRDGWFALAGIEYVTHYENMAKTIGTKVPVLVSTPFYVTQKDMEENASPYIIAFESKLKRADVTSFPLWIFWLTLACIVCRFLGHFRIFLLMPLLTVIFAMELHYFIIKEGNFWWCNFDTMGWFKAIAFFLLSLGAIYMQFRMYFDVIADIKAMSRPFNTAIGTTLYAAFVIGTLIYAIFVGEISDRLLIVFSLIFLVIQEIIIVVALRKNPVALLVTMIFLPLGMFALVITSLKFFAVLALFTIIGLVVYAWAMSKGDGVGGGTSLERGDAPHCSHINYPYCTFGGHNHDCNLLNGGRSCQHGQR